MPLAIDEFPALFVAAACAEGETVVTGAEELRVKESDRIAVMAEGLQALGVECEVLPDGMRIQGRAGGYGVQRWRRSTATAITASPCRSRSPACALRAPIEIRDVANVATSFPGFLATARAAGLDVRHVER